MLNYVIEILSVFLGVLLAFAVENVREARRDRAVGREYVAGFREDFVRDVAEIGRMIEFREAQVVAAAAALQFFRGKVIDVDAFFGALYAVYPIRRYGANRHTIDEVLNAGHLHLVSDADFRAKILDLYALYRQIAATEDHISVDYHTYLYDTTFSMVPLDLEGPWSADPNATQHAECLISSISVANGLKLAEYNIAEVLLPDLREAQRRLNELLTFGRT